jgi:hypothetical protein
MCHHPDYGCEQHFHHAGQRSWHHRWGCCCGPAYIPRQFPTREEIVEELEEYLKQLQAEAKGVEERITELKKEG